jgi:ribosomal protein S18 acetylase RimI-like enzyme
MQGCSAAGMQGCRDARRGFRARAAGSLVRVSEVLIRAVRPDEWERMRDFRLEALRDEVAAIAFSASLGEVAAHPDELWQARARAGSEDAGTDARQRSFVAVDGETWLGTLTVLIADAGDADYTGHVLTARAADVVGVYVSPSARGRGIVQALLDAAAEWTCARGLPELRLLVHAQNPRARRAYEKSGFALTGEVVEIGTELELAMVRPLCDGSLARILQ